MITCWYYSWSIGEVGTEFVIIIVIYSDASKFLEGDYNVAVYDSFHMIRIKGITE